MPALAQRAGTKNKLINYHFGQKTREEPDQSPENTANLQTGFVVRFKVKSRKILKEIYVFFVAK